MIQACDNAFDRSKMQVKMNGFREKNAQGAPKKFQRKNEEKKEKSSLVLLKVDADAICLSHIMEIKNIFRASPGSTAVRMEFHARNALVGMVSIDSNWGVQVDSKFESSLKRVVGVFLIQVEEI